ncbi:MAG: hypothetical protein J1F01_08880 [Oscillospiraceae bacterium]|nr:hypothetical protein [Oscillospiraceae bacterium]
MAEKYGTIPPRFTKEWWDYCWYYYKWHVTITLVAVIVAAVTIVQCVNRPIYDMTVIYAGHMNYSEGEKERLEAILNAYVTDIDGNGKTAVDFQRLMFSGAAGNEEYDYAMQTKLDLTFTEKNTALYLMDREEAEFYLKRSSVADAFMNTDDYAADTEKEILRAADGTGYAVNLSDSTILKESNIYCDDLFVLVRLDNADENENNQVFKDAVNIAKELIN